MDDLTQQAIDAMRAQFTERIRALEAEIAARDRLYAERAENYQRQRTEAIEAIRAKIDANDERYGQRVEQYFEAQKATVAAMEARLLGMNEIRGAMADMAGTMLPRREFEQVRDQFQHRIEQFRPGLGERVTEHGEILATLVPRREFDEARNVILDKFEAHRKTAEAQLDGAVEPLRAKIETVGRPNWALMASALSVLIVIIAGAGTVIGLKIDGAISPVQLSLEQTKVGLAGITERVRTIDGVSQASAQADQASRTDRMQLNDRVRNIEATQAQRASAIAEVSQMRIQLQQVVDRQAEARSETTRQAAALVEIETQFCAADIMRNLMHAQDMRIQSMLWAKAYDQGIPLPTDNAYYPQICNRPQITNSAGGK